MLENFYRKSRNSVDSGGKKEAPYGFVIPAGQPDMTRVVMLVKHAAHARHRSRQKATAEIKLKDWQFPHWLLCHQTRPAIRTARQNPARKTKLPHANLRTYLRHRVDDGLMHQATVKEITIRRSGFDVRRAVDR